MDPDTFAMLRVFLNAGGMVTAVGDSATGNDDFLASCIQAYPEALNWRMTKVCDDIQASIVAHLSSFETGSWASQAAYGLRPGPDIDHRYAQFMEISMNLIDDLNKALRLVQTGHGGAIITVEDLVRVIVKGCPDFVLGAAQDSQLLFEQFDPFFQRVLVVCRG